MEQNQSFFESGEADEWFKRNIKALEGKKDISHDASIKLLIDWLKLFANEILDVLEIGCGSGHRLNRITNSISAKGYGVEPSNEAVKYIQRTFPKIEAKLGYGDDVLFFEKFELVHLGFFLYLVDRENYLRCISVTDRLVKLSLVAFYRLLILKHHFHIQTHIPIKVLFFHTNKIIAMFL